VVVTYNEGNAGVVGELVNDLQVRDVVAGVADALDVDGLGLLVDGGGDVLGAVALDELGLDAQAGEEDLELVVGAAVEVGGGDNVVASVSQGVDDNELGGLAGGGSEASDTALEGRYPLLEDVDGGLSGKYVSMGVLAGGRCGGQGASKGCVRS
jgi:hypothetical protein